MAQVLRANAALAEALTSVPGTLLGLSQPPSGPGAEHPVPVFGLFR